MNTRTLLIRNLQRHHQPKVLILVIAVSGMYPSRVSVHCFDTMTQFARKFAVPSLVFRDSYNLTRTPRSLNVYTRDYRGHAANCSHAKFHHKNLYQYPGKSVIGCQKNELITKLLDKHFLFHLFRNIR